MSLTDSLCDLCGDYTEAGNPKSRGSSHTDRLWCGKCKNLSGQPSETDIIVWLFNKDKTLTIAEEDPATPHAPITRPDWDTYYLGIAAAVSARGDCSRRQIGAVIVKGHKIVATGYNGTPPGDIRSCGSTGFCPRNLDPSSRPSEGAYDECWTTHAEANALMRASWEELQDSTIYITGSPCPGCTKLIASSGIAKTVVL